MPPFRVVVNQSFTTLRITWWCVRWNLAAPHTRDLCQGFKTSGSIPDHLIMDGRASSLILYGMLTGLFFFCIILGVGSIIGLIDDTQYTTENYQLLQITTEKFKSADQELPGLLDKSTGDITMMFFGKGMAEVYYIKDTLPGKARKEVYGGSDDSMAVMSVVKSFRVDTDMEIYTFICRPDGEMRRGFMHISMEDIHPPVLPNNIVEYCEKAGGC